jgi:DNA polymerase-3 subunit beta
MKVQISQAGLHDIVAWATAAVPPRVDTGTPHLGGVRLEAADGILTAAAYDRRVARRWSAPASTGEPGVILPPARVFAEVTGRLPARAVELETGENENTLILTCGAARYDFPLLDARAYPDIPVVPAACATFDAAALIRAAERTAFAANPEHVEAAATVVHFEPDPASGTMVLVATDKYRVSAARVPYQSCGEDVPEVNIPASALRDWARAMKTGSGPVVTMGFSRDFKGAPVTAGLADGSRETTIRLTALEEYLKWQKWAALPKEFEAAEVDTAGMIAAIRPLAALIKPLSPLYCTFTPGEVQLATSRVSGRASGADSFPVTYDGPRIQLAFRAQFLEEALAAAGGVATFIMTGSGKPVYVTPVTESGKGGSGSEEDFLHVVMPISSPTEPPPE